MKPWKLILSFVAVFLLGGAVGGMLFMHISQKILFSPPAADEMASQMVEHLTRVLDLTPEQVRRIEPIAQRSCAELIGTQKEMIALLAQKIGKSNSEIEDILNPEQKKKFQEMEAKRRQFMGGL